MQAPRRGTAVVAEVGWVNGLGAIRSLGRAGLRVVALDHRRWALGFRSRYAEPLLCPDPLEDEEGFLRVLADLGRTLDEPAPIFPTHDEHLNAIARNAGELAGAFRFPFPDWATLERIQSKRHQVERAEETGLAVPRTRHPRSEAEAREAGEELGYPLIVKPSDPQRFKQLYRRQAFFCNGWDELAHAYALAEAHEPMVQEFVPGGNEHLWTLGSYLAADGEALGLFCGRKLRQTRGWMGSARVGEAVWDDEVVESGLRLLRALGFHGVSQVELKRDPRDGRLKVIEVNPRLWQWHSLAEACGVNLPWIASCHLLGRPLPPVRMREEGKRWAITFMAGSGQALQRFPYVDGVFALDDPKPALMQGVRLARRAGRALGGNGGDGGGRRVATR